VVDAKRAALQEKVAKLKAEFADHLPGRLEEILIEWQAYKNDGLLDEQLSSLYRNVHSLAGASATFGFEEMSVHARLCEKQLRKMMDASVVVNEDVVEAESMLMTLHSEYAN
jgi:HPt (histidine-containing phosphotransfer) domain-containing protein